MDEGTELLTEWTFYSHVGVVLCISVLCALKEDRKLTLCELWILCKFVWRKLDPFEEMS